MTPIYPTRVANLPAPLLAGWRSVAFVVNCNLVVEAGWVGLFPVDSSGTVEAVLAVVRQIPGVRIERSTEFVTGAPTVRLTTREPEAWAVLEAVLASQPLPGHVAEPVRSDPEERLVMIQKAARYAGGLAS